MRIAQIAPLYEAVPPKRYGGTERVVSFLTEELVALGHDVTLFASGDSQTSATLVPVRPQALRLDPSVRDPMAPHALMLEQVLRRAHEFDLLHFHLDYLPFSLFSRQEVPWVTTLHGRLDLPELGPIFDAFPDAPVVSISDAQRAPLPQAGWAATIHHGLPKDLLTPRDAEPGYLAFLGRIAPEKRPDRAIRIAAEAGLPLKIAAKVDKADAEYYARHIEPLVAQAHVEFIGEICDREKPGFLSGARALLVPIDWPEPFGLVMIEAMACGTPVIAYNHGSVPEVIEDGLTGFIVRNEEEAVAAVRRLPELSRARIRRRFEERFTARRMAEDYVSLYQSLARTARPLLRVV
ncbi:glycosyltransferase family 4 protein [Roseomonas gilardii]|uniref:glycosyltransferase family 4 protein n=1 Tax=Roseomonas gilardii TaxID=257708 RepID=UPI0004885EE1|nr:glycosyltransferase family 4 protein [Roseomonas gilardii]SUE43184.1 Spore coat protein SA [Roseomonas gilardii subsp. rosea]